MPFILIGGGMAGKRLLRWEVFWNGQSGMSAMIFCLVVVK